MASISVDDSTKAEFDDMKPDNLTHDEFVDELLKAYKRDNGQVVDPSEIADEIRRQAAADIELAAYRGVIEAIDDRGNNE